MIYIELLELYYKKYTGTVQSSDYILWANHHLYMDILEIKMLASMSVIEPLNLFEIEKMFADAMKAMKRKDPSKEESIKYHLQCLHSQLLMPTQKAVSIVKEIYSCTVKHDLFEEQMNWLEISDAIDDFQYGDNQNGYTGDKINEMIVKHARTLWHIKKSEITFKELVGKKVTSIDSNIQFIIQLEKGTIIIESPWRIRNAQTILLGETDIQANQKEWQTIEELLIGKTIEDVQLFEQCPLLIIQIDNIFLDVFHASSFFDGWTLTDEEDFYMFSMHGGDIV